ncbi:uncharacterized protein [Triticum aestivum]|uniref:uncharacterized protein n=1 Tax=Triticum aestivum TaxID=4565 RepID=UPI001D002821|nr:uncharacterized protein LOC123121251 [Triticum aestivum]
MTGVGGVAMKPADEDAMESIRLDSKDFKGWKFEKFARSVDNRLLVRSNADLQTFQLHWDEYLPNGNAVRRWMKYAVNHKVKVLDVILRDYDKSHLPPCIFTCRSLQELNLQWGGANYDDLEHIRLVIPDRINFPSLRKLTLRDVQVDGLTLETLIAYSPHLEDMHLIDDSLMYLQLIASKVLKRLTIDGYIDSKNGFTISAPHLISFECKRYKLKDISWGDQPTLESAHIDSRGKMFDGESNYTEILVHAKKIALFGSDIKVMLEKELPTCSAVESLTTLEIGDWHLTNDLYVVLRFLQLSPRLEKIKLDEGAGTNVRSTDGMTFQCPLLESVVIQCFEGGEGIDMLGNVMAANGIADIMQLGIAELHLSKASAPAALLFVNTHCTVCLHAVNAQ